MKRDGSKPSNQKKKIINLVNLEWHVSCFGCYLILGAQLLRKTIFGLILGAKWGGGMYQELDYSGNGDSGQS